MATNHNFGPEMYPLELLLSETLSCNWDLLKLKILKTFHAIKCVSPEASISYCVEYCKWTRCGKIPILFKSTKGSTVYMRAWPPLWILRWMKQYSYSLIAKYTLGRQLIFTTIALRALQLCLNINSINLSTPFPPTFLFYDSRRNLIESLETSRNE